MTNDIAKLQKAVFAHLAADASLSTLMGGAKIYDRPSEGASLPYITLGVTRSFNADTASEDAQEHLFTIHAWSRQGGRKEALALIHAVHTRLETIDTIAEGMRIVTLRAQSQDVNYNEDVNAYRGTLRLRAITEAETL